MIWQGGTVHSSQRLCLGRQCRWRRFQRRACLWRTTRRAWRKRRARQHKCAAAARSPCYEDVGRTWYCRNNLNFRRSLRCELVQATLIQHSTSRSIWMARLHDHAPLCAFSPRRPLRLAHRLLCSCRRGARATAIAAQTFGHAGWAIRFTLLRACSSTSPPAVTHLRAKHARRFPTRRRDSRSTTPRANESTPTAAARSRPCASHRSARRLTLCATRSMAACQRSPSHQIYSDGFTPSTTLIPPRVGRISPLQSSCTRYTASYRPYPQNTGTIPSLTSCELRLQKLLVASPRRRRQQAASTSTSSTVQTTFGVHETADLNSIFGLHDTNVQLQLVARFVGTSFRCEPHFGKSCHIYRCRPSRKPSTSEMKLAP